MFKDFLISLEYSELTTHIIIGLIVLILYDKTTLLKEFGSLFWYLFWGILTISLLKTLWGKGTITFWLSFGTIIFWALINITILLIIGYKKNRRFIWVSKKTKIDFPSSTYLHLLYGSLFLIEIFISIILIIKFFP